MSALCGDDAIDVYSKLTEPTLLVTFSSRTPALQIETFHCTGGSAQPEHRLKREIFSLFLDKYSFASARHWRQSNVTISIGPLFHLAMTSPQATSFRVRVTAPLIGTINAIADSIQAVTGRAMARIETTARFLARATRLSGRTKLSKRDRRHHRRWAQPRHERIQALGPGGFHQVAYREWGRPENPNVVVCVHGLTRNSHDFDFLAADLSADFRVVCMDVVGRGDSEWLIDKRDYGFSLYQSDAAALLARITAPAWRSPGSNAGGPGANHAPPRIDWVGTSMGGLIGMMLAAKNNSPIRRLVLNDVGPMIPWTALMTLSGGLSGDGPTFANIAQVELHLRSACAEFGPLTDAQWRHLAGHHSRQSEDGRYVLTFDPAIIAALTRNPQFEFALGADSLRGINLWPVWDKVRCPALVLRGAQSGVLLAATAREMQRRHPCTQVVEFAGIGHAPWVATESQIKIVRDFLLDSSSRHAIANQDACIPISTHTMSTP